MKRWFSFLMGIFILAACSSPKIPKEQTGFAKSNEVEGSYVTAEVTLRDGKLTKVRIDETGAISVDGVRSGTKKQLGDDYGMRPYSDIGKEWYEQIEALEKYIEEHGVEAIEIKDNCVANDDLKTSVTIKVTEYIETVKAAIAKAQEDK